VYIIADGEGDEFLKAEVAIEGGEGWDGFSRINNRGFP
jgi:hypothetical protein